MSERPTVKTYDGSALQNAQNVPCPQLNFQYDPNTKRGSFVAPNSGKPEIVHKKIAAYIPDSAIQKTVELMQILRRPLLLRGEPGSGKTKLAQAVAYEWYNENYQQYYFEWHVKSTAKAQDGLYTFDHIARLRDVQTGKNFDKKTYREFGPLGKAFAVSTKENPAVVLIDEIDKADIDFPNDLLLELDEDRFFIKETEEEIIASYPPVIFITSNQERELPPAFLRRCLFHFIEFPKEDKLRKIVEANFPDFYKQEAEVVSEVLERFDQLRTAINNDPTVSKNVSTSELLDWLRVMDYHFNLGEAIDKTDLEGLLRHHQVLLKSYNDLVREGILRHEGI